MTREDFYRLVNTVNKNMEENEAQNEIENSVIARKNFYRLLKKNIEEQDTSEPTTSDSFRVKSQVQNSKKLSDKPLYTSSSNKKYFEALNEKKDEKCYAGMPFYPANKPHSKICHIRHSGAIKYLFFD